MKRRTKPFVQIAIAAVVALAMMAAFVAVGGVSGNHSQVVLAKGGKGQGGSKPGWGCGDTNHTHTGPPGNQSMSSPCGTTSGSTTDTTNSTTTGTSTTGSQGGTRPGWGCGDTNHTHTGPPGNTSMTSPCGTSSTTSTTSTTASATTSTGASPVHKTKKNHTKKNKTKKSKKHSKTTHK